MASVFLSYARADAAKAKALALALGKALGKSGHDIWWDRHIHGGSEFAGEIQAALNDAKVVLVLWSRASIGSEWVRDEATEGRDSGRLLPVVLDDSKPPLGFRQRQSIDLSGWSGRGQPPHFADLLAALSERLSAEPGDRPAPLLDDPPRRPSRTIVAAAAAAILALAIALAAWLGVIGGLRPAATPTLAILPFADLSPGGDKAYFAEGVAEAILSTLASDPDIKVIGRTSAGQFQGGKADLATIRKALGVTHVLEGSARTEGDQLRLSVRLVDAADGKQVWADDYDRRMSAVFAVQDEIGKAVAQRLRGTLAARGRQAPGPVTGIDAYSLYLAARAKMKSRDEKGLREAMDLARRVIALDPAYAPGHALYAELVSMLANNPYYWARNPAYFFSGKDPRATANRIANAHAKRAIRLAPASAEGYAALGLFADRPEVTVQALTKAIALDPSRTELRGALGSAYGQLGRRAEAVAQFRAAADMDPLWHIAVRRLAALYASSGRHAEAEAVVDGFLKRGGRPAQVARMRAMLARVRGDLAAAEKHSRLAYKLKPDEEMATHLLILYQPHWLDRPDLARRLPVVPNSEIFPRLILAGRNQAELAQVRSEGASIWTKPWESNYVVALAAARDWRHLETLYDARPDLMSRLCEGSGNDNTPVAMILALRERGRGSEASQLLGCFEKRLDREGSGPWSVVFSEAYLAFAKAQLLAIRGDRRGALRALDRAVAKGWRGLGMSPHFADYPALDPLRTAPEYARAQARLAQILAAQRRALNQAG